MSWKKYTCIHGVQEGLDSHDCPQCRKLTTEEFGESEPTHVYIQRKKKKIPAIVEIVELDGKDACQTCKGTKKITEVVGNKNTTRTELRDCPTCCVPVEFK